MDKKKINKKESGEDATKYGEFVSSFFTMFLLIFPSQKEMSKSSNMLSPASSMLIK